MEERRRREPGQEAGILDRIPRPVASPAKLFVRPDHPERQAEGQEQPAEHRPAAHRTKPRVVQVTRDERGDAERERNRHADEAGVQRRRMNRHVEVLQQGVQPLAVGRRRCQKRGERVLVRHHQVQEEHLHRGDGGDDIGNQLAVPLAVHVDRQRSEDRQEEHPEHDRAVQPAPVRRDLVEQRLHAVRIVRDVLDGVVAGQERIDQHGRRRDHERADQVERADAAFNQRARSASCADHRDDGGVAARDEGGKKEKRAK